MLLDFKKTCRLCLNQDSNLISVFNETDISDSVLPLPSTILACVSIEVFVGDKMPSQICNKCIQQLDNWVKFKEICNNSNMFLQECLTNMKTSTVEDNDILGKNLLGKSNEKGSDLVIPDTLPDMDVSFFEQDSLFRVFDDSHQDIWQSTDCLNTEFADTILNPIFNCSDSPSEKRANIENENSEKKSSNAAAKYKLKYDKIYKNQYSCEFCQKIFSKFSQLLQHDLSDHTDLIANHSCPLCSRIFISEARVNLHVTLKHKEKCYECDVCGVKTVSKKCLSIHKRKHSGKFTCKECGLSTSSKNMLMDHQRVHTGERPFECNLCDAKFSTKKSRDVHVTTHTKSKINFKCDICSVVVGSASGLRAHEASHSVVKSTMCDVCGKTYKTQVSLSNHKKTHSIKEFSCSVCDKTFYTKYLLQRHFLSHSDFKLFMCHLCDKGFNRRDTLKFHIQLHSDEKQFSCELCDKAYVLKRDLIKHVKRYHNNENGIKEQVCALCSGSFKMLKKHKCNKISRESTEGNKIIKEITE